ncbi:leucine-rich repeat domain-containing protein [Anaerocolumna sp. AGMB13020]|uniref:leucine-rich repeat domain-containing protein n=1 Tax=Anaerocolumna sp. AGMB13020 TaxID=3081750 RepID=UPI002952DC06|nr:leucine-rich repeat domain-containing protein [Anaerocolumna sp. AGMB13020]WOO37860.1 leucine-rich repeat domain-containing protein [Anaerocolumna sp. AGMB13020]
MYKKILKYLLGVTWILFLMFQCSYKVVNANSANTVTDAEGFVIQDGYLLVGYVGTAKDIVIPDNVSFMFEACMGSTDIDSVVIPNTVEGMDKFIFTHSKVKKVVFQEGSKIDKLSDGIFSSCKNLKEVQLPKSLKIIGNGAFEAAGIVSIEIPDGVTIIEGGAFIGSSLTKIAFPDSLEEISSSAFFECKQLKDLRFPKNLKTIGDGAFRACYKLTSIELPESITEIGEYAFFLCSGIKTVKIKGNIKELAKGIFSGCESLTSITYPDSVEKIGDSAFTNTSFKTLPISKNIKTIGVSAFIDNTVTSIKIPDGVETIGAYAFQNCSNLKTVYIPKSVTSIGSRAFGLCSNLEKLTIMNPFCKVFSYQNDNIFFKGSKANMLKKVKVYGYKGSATAELCSLYNIKFISIDKTEMDYPELKNVKETKIEVKKDSYSLKMGKELKIPYKVTNANGYKVKVTGGVEYFDGLGYEVVKVVKITDDYILVKGGIWPGNVTISVRVGLTSKTIKINVK